MNEKTASTTEIMVEMLRHLYVEDYSVIRLDLTKSRNNEEHELEYPKRKLQVWKADSNFSIRINNISNPEIPIPSTTTPLRPIDNILIQRIFITNTAGSGEAIILLI
ncbi:MAG: hypothetical protein ACTSV7_06840 [Candidatus Baldrarchaeia archaeon]